MRLASSRVWQWTVAWSLGWAGMAALAQSSNVPDAPAPQTLPRLNTITPTAPAVNAPAPQPTPQPAGAGTAPNALPSAPTPAAPTAQTPAQTPATQDDADQGPPPVTSFNKLPPVQVNFVEIPFTVRDSRGQLVPGLTPREVQVYENGLRQRISFFTADPLPLSVAIVIDQSVTFDTMQKINASLNSLQGVFAPFDEVAVFTYNNGVNEQTSFTGAQSARLTFALEHSKAPGRDPNMAMGGPLDQTTVKNNLPVDPNTNRNAPAGVILQTPEREYHTLNDAILTAAETVAKAGRGRRRIIYVISDGREYGSKASMKEVIRFLQTNQISVYGTLVGDASVPGVAFLDRIHLPLQMRDNVLPKYTAATGGDYDGAFRPKGIQDSFAKIAEQVRLEYTLGYYSHEPIYDSKFRSVDVRVLRPNLDVIAPKGYYPRPQQSGPSQPPTTAASPAPTTGTPAATQP